jgi:hypothetical protein
MFSRSIKLNLNNRANVIDAQWHPKQAHGPSSIDDCVVCLTSNNNLRFYKVSSPNHHFKEFHIDQSNLDTIVSSTDLAGFQSKGL